MPVWIGATSPLAVEEARTRRTTGSGGIATKTASSASIAGSDPFRGAFVDLGQSAENALPDWRLVVPQWEFDLEAGRFVPNLDLLERLPALRLNIEDFLANMDLPPLDNLSVPLPDFHKGNLSTQDALVSASSYLASQRPLSSESESG